MSLANYAELQTFLASMATRSDMTALIPDFIQLGEGMIARKVRAIDIVTKVTLGESSRVSGGVYNLPGDYLGVRAIFGTYNGADYEASRVSLAELRNYKSTAPPFMFTTYGLLVEFRGSPQTDQDFDLVYYERPDALSVTATNTLFLNHPALYVHSALYYLHLKAQDVELAKEHKAIFDATADDINELADLQRGSGRTAPAYNFGLINARSSM